MWVIHGAEEALVHWCETRGLAARPLHMIGYGEEEEAGEAAADPAASEDADPAASGAPE